MRELKLWKAIDLEHLNAKQQVMLEKMDDNTKSLLRAVLSVVSPLMRVNELNKDGTRSCFEYKFSGITSHVSENEIQFGNIIIDTSELTIRSGNRHFIYNNVPVVISNNDNSCNIASYLYADLLYEMALKYIKLLKNKKERLRKQLDAVRSSCPENISEDYYNRAVIICEETYNEVLTFNELSDDQKTVLNEFLTYSALMLTFTASRREDVAPLGEGRLDKYLESKEFINKKVM